MMRKTVYSFVWFLFAFYTLSAQYHLDVRGHAWIQGRLDLSHNYDSTSIYLGRAAGKVIDTSGFSINRRNTALGFQTYKISDQGTSNTFVGSRAGSEGTGSLNAFFGSDAGRYTLGNNNAFFGASSGLSNLSGNHNSFFGISSGNSNLEGAANTFLGAYAGGNNENADYNTYIGFQCGQFVSGDTSQHNTFVGANSGQVKIGGKENVFLGGESGFRNREGDFNTLVGVRAGAGDNAFRMDYCTFVGYESGEQHQAGPSTFMGAFSGTNNTTGQQNTFIGTSSGFDNMDGNENTFVGYTTGFKNTSGHRNTFIGKDAGREITVGSDNICLGRNAGPTANVSNRLYIDVMQTDEPLIYGDFGSDQVKVNGLLQTEANQAIIQMQTKNHPSGSVLVLQSHATTPVDIGAINFNNELGHTNGQIGYTGNEEMDFRVDGVDPFMTLTNGTDHIVMSNGATLTSGGVWTNSCSAELKELHSRLDGRLIVQKLQDLPLYDWSYKSNHERHAGPTAEDFHRAFGLGNSNKALACVDIGGVALSAIQELIAVNKELHGELDRIKERLREIETTSKN